MPKFEEKVLIYNSKPKCIRYSWANKNMKKFNLKISYQHEVLENTYFFLMFTNKLNYTIIRFILRDHIIHFYSSVEVW